ncbi:molybdopterin-guanine dinucleotide biosynthesis protein B [Saccharibacillus kuerlensis]|uniref:Molybdopterin-guanine dinucleotide biosynthesis protein B (MobB) domain-containing protein n=1 Tax=Saccharibacillus kuerlensis TaxID=459527 RepID=A0ABQ2L626_9BACL|nr:molybdopterin-guanine dinucleotide biosynthesis protein B [Saccharibacillus kuerlensis]GGO02036.1 hypothetical protein GCM10010969_24910 [Saccharibacillus kuerlensis]
MGPLNGSEETGSSERSNIVGSPLKNKPRLLQIVGFKNSGKTTLTEMLLRRAIELGWITSAIKRHGHGGVPDLPPAGTDSSRLFETGAASSIVSGGGVMLLQGRQQPEESEGLDPLIRLTKAYASPDLILIEGFKEEPYPKIVLLRSLEDWRELHRLNHIGLVVVADHTLAKLLMGESAYGRSVHGHPGHNHPVDGAASNVDLPPVDAAISILSREQTEDITAWFTTWLEGGNDESL